MTFREGVRKRSSENARKAKEANVTDKKREKNMQEIFFYHMIEFDQGRTKYCEGILSGGNQIF